MVHFWFSPDFPFTPGNSEGAQAHAIYNKIMGRARQHTPATTVKKTQLYKCSLYIGPSPQSRVFERGPWKMDRSASALN